MNINNCTDAIKNCRFCFMCRHLSAIGNVTFTEADTPRVRAAMTYGVTMYPEKLANRDYIDTLYRSDLSACCRFHCVSHFDENGLNLAARTDVVEAGFAPEYVKAIVAELKKNEKWVGKGSGDVLYFVDNYTAEAKTVAKAFDTIMKKAKIPYQTVTGGCIGKALSILGYKKEAKEAMQKFAQVIRNSKAKTVVVSNPAAYDALVNDYKAAGIKLTAKVVHTSEYIKSLKLKFAKKAGKVFYLESDYLKNYNDDYQGPRDLLAAVKAEIVPFGTNNEESYTCGEGAVVLPKIDEKLVEKLAKYIEARADNPAKDVIVVASPYTKLCLEKYTALNVKTLEELAAGCL